MLVSAAVVLAAPLTVTALAAGQVSVEDAMEALGIRSPEPPQHDMPAPEPDVEPGRMLDRPPEPSRERAAASSRATRAGAQGAKAEATAPGEPEPPSGDTATPEADGGAPAPPQALPSPEAPSPSEPEEQPGLPLDEVEGKLDDALGGAKDVLEKGGKSLLP